MSFTCDCVVWIETAEPFSYYIIHLKWWKYKTALHGILIQHFNTSIAFLSLVINHGEKETFDIFYKNMTQTSMFKALDIFFGLQSFISFFLSLFSFL